MNAGFTYLAISLFSVISGKALDEDMLLYWRRTDSSKCEPFTTYFIGCNKCVCSADGTPFCTRMACFKSARFLTDEPAKITPVDDLNQHDRNDYDSQPIRTVEV